MVVLVGGGGEVEVAREAYLEVGLVVGGKDVVCDVDGSRAVQDFHGAEERLACDPFSSVPKSSMPYSMCCMR